MTRTHAGARAARQRTRASSGGALAALFGALFAALAAAPSFAQAITVIGDPGAEDCYHAANLGDASPSALQACDHAIETGALLGRNLAATYLNRGIVHAARADFEAALADYAEARRIRRDLPESYVGEGNVLFMMGDFAGALTAYDTALSHGLGRGQVAHFNRGLTFEQLGRWDDAEAAYREAAALAPEWSLPPAYLARLEQKRAAAEAAAGTN